MINILLNGANGKMGKAFANYINNIDDFNLQYSIDRDNSYLLKSFLKKPDVIIDFSTPSASIDCLNYAVENLVPTVIATTGFSEKDESKIMEFAEAIPIFKSSNLSFGINIISDIASQVSKKFTNSDIEVIEKHHRNKKDAPSGTALMIANNINKKNNNKYTFVFNKNNNHDIPKEYNEICFSSIRGGNLVGEHSILFIKNDEIIEITHKAYSRDIYIKGALKAARFIINRKNGLFTMDDLL